MSAGLPANELSLFLLVLCRVSGLVLSAPVIGDQQVPPRVKATLAIALAIVLVQVPAVAHTQAPTSLLPFALAVLVQLFLGITLGFVARIAFFAVQTAGGILSLQTGLTMSAVLDPLTRQPDSPLSQLYTVIAGMIFLALQGEVWVVAALARSFDLTPLGTTIDASTLVGRVVSDALLVTQLGIQIAMPVAASLLVANVILGVVSRSLPQLNLFMLSMPLNVLIGLVALIGALGAILLLIGNYMNNLPQTMLGILPHAS